MNVCSKVHMDNVWSKRKLLQVAKVKHRKYRAGSCLYVSETIRVHTQPRALGHTTFIDVSLN
jgi:hypothetical protein